MTRTHPPIAWVSTGSWKEGTAEFDTGHPVRDEALRRLNQAAVTLRVRRERAHLSAHTVARWAGLRRQTVSDLENGQSWADAVTVHRIAIVLGLDSHLRPDPQGSMGPRA
ncbi:MULTISPECIES: helix-turn-helix transcriptional regulator [unclassified Modestobacter]